MLKYQIYGNKPLFIIEILLFVGDQKLNSSYTKFIQIYLKYCCMYSFDY